MQMQYSRRLLLLLPVAALSATTGSFPAPVHAAAKFGTYCQERFENGWASTEANGYDLCSKFNSALDDTDTKVFCCVPLEGCLRQ